MADCEEARLLEPPYARRSEQIANHGARPGFDLCALPLKSQVLSQCCCLPSRKFRNSSIDSIERHSFEAGAIVRAKRSTHDALP